MALINKASENQNTTKWLRTAKSRDPPPAQSSHAVQRTLSAPTQSSITFILKKDCKHNQFLDVLAQKKTLDAWKLAPSSPRGAKRQLTCRLREGAPNTTEKQDAAIGPLIKREGI